MNKWINEYMNIWINEQINKWIIELPLFYLWFCPRNPSPLYFYKHFTSILNIILHIKKNECVMEDQTVVALGGRMTKSLYMAWKRKMLGLIAACLPRSSDLKVVFDPTMLTVSLSNHPSLKPFQDIRSIFSFRSK